MSDESELSTWQVVLRNTKVVLAIIYLVALLGLSFAYSIGWGMNVYEVTQMDWDSEFGTLQWARLAGLLIDPLGSILGWFW